MIRFKSRREREPLGPTRRMRASGPQETACQFTMTIPADPAAISTTSDVVTHVLKEHDWPEDDVMAVQLAVDEALANAIRHGCGGDVTKHVRCSVAYDESDEVVIVVRDPGSGFDPRAIADPLNPANIFHPSGRGIFLISELMDEVQFADGGREVQMRKRRHRASRTIPFTREYLQCRSD